ncbi:hypothetical protein T08_15711 [Trichinella sp. T8]|nr:hypothetical protein T08_15711 [Trichinella sp. T8]
MQSARWTRIKKNFFQQQDFFPLSLEQIDNRSEKTTRLCLATLIFNANKMFNFVQCTFCLLCEWQESIDTNNKFCLHAEHCSGIWEFYFSNYRRKFVGFDRFLETNTSGLVYNNRRKRLFRVNESFIQTDDLALFLLNRRVSL